MPIWAFQKRIIGNPTPEKAAFVSSFADCDELFVINQRFLNIENAEEMQNADSPSDDTPSESENLISVQISMF